MSQTQTPEQAPQTQTPQISTPEQAPQTPQTSHYASASWGAGIPLYR